MAASARPVRDDPCGRRGRTLARTVTARSSPRSQPGDVTAVSCPSPRRHGTGRAGSPGPGILTDAAPAHGRQPSRPGRATARPSGRRRRPTVTTVRRRGRPAFGGGCAGHGRGRAPARPAGHRARRAAGCGVRPLRPHGAAPRRRAGRAREPGRRRPAVLPRPARTAGPVRRPARHAAEPLLLRSRRPQRRAAGRRGLPPGPAGAGQPGGAGPLGHRLPGRPAHRRRGAGAGVAVRDRPPAASLDRRRRPDHDRPGRCLLLRAPAAHRRLAGHRRADAGGDAGPGHPGRQLDPGRAAGRGPARPPGRAVPRRLVHRPRHGRGGPGPAQRGPAPRGRAGGVAVAVHRGPGRRPGAGRPVPVGPAHGRGPRARGRRTSRRAWRPACPTTPRRCARTSAARPPWSSRCGPATGPRGR